MGTVSPDKLMAHKLDKQAVAAEDAWAAATEAGVILYVQGKYPDMDTALKLMKNNFFDLAAYLNDTNAVCTVFLPTNKVRCKVAAPANPRCPFSQHLYGELLPG
jgi:hypothetical protein